MNAVRQPDADVLEGVVRAGMSDAIRVVREGRDAYRVLTPYVLPDGDGLSIVLRSSDGEWLLTDEGQTYMHLSYSIDPDQLLEGSRGRIVADALNAFNVTDEEGQLTMSLASLDDLPGALFDFVQAQLKVSDVTFLSRELVRSTFLEDLRSLIGEHVPSSMVERNWHEPTHDQKRLYPVDFYVRADPRPLMLFAMPTENAVKEAIISLGAMERWGIPRLTVGVYEDQEQISRRSVAQLTDVISKGFSNLDGNRDRLAVLLDDVVAGRPV